MRKLSLTMAELTPQIYYLECTKKLHAHSCNGTHCRYGCFLVIALQNSNTFSYPSSGLSLVLANTWNSCQRTTCSVVLAKKSHKVFSHFTPSQAVIKHCLLPALTKRQHGKCGVQWMMWWQLSKLLARLQWWMLWIRWCLLYSWAISQHASCMIVLAPLGK